MRTKVEEQTTTPANVMSRLLEEIGGKNPETFLQLAGFLDQAATYARSCAHAQEQLDLRGVLPCRSCGGSMSVDDWAGGLREHKDCPLCESCGQPIELDDWAEGLREHQECPICESCERPMSMVSWKNGHRQHEGCPKKDEPEAPWTVTAL